MTELANTPMMSPAAAIAPGAVRRPRRRRPPRPMAMLRWSHRWVSIVAGLALLTITTSGAILVLEPEFRQVAHPGRFHATHGAHPRTPDQAIAAAERRFPRAGAATRVVRNRGVYEVALGATPETVVSVDPGSGRVLGRTRPERGVLGFVVNLHECGLTCEGYPGYLHALSRPMPGLGIPGLAKVQIGSFVLAAFGFLLLGLVLSGVVLWWPGVRRWRRGFQVRRHKGRYGRDYDLHKLVGVVSLPFLAMWAITGMNFELPVVGKAVYAVIGAAPGPDPSLASRPAHDGAPDIGVARADAAARRLVPGGRVVGTNLPDKDPTSTYMVWLAHGLDPLRDGDYAGNVGVAVDRHRATARVLYGRLGRPLRQTLWEDWTTGAHFGQAVGWLPRLGWLLLGLTPLVLAFTGMSTWLYRRGKRRARRRRHRAAAPAA